MECNKNNKNFIENLEINSTENMSKEEEIAYYDYLLKKIEKEFIDNYDTSKLDNGEDEYITTEKMTWTFTTLENQRKNINNNMTTIDLGECEALLRAEYNISYNKTLYIKIIDIAQEETKASKVEYDVYCKLFGTNLIKLNLTVCSKSKISIYKLIELTDNLDKYNISSGFYNDICYTTTSEDGTDITLKDRQKNFIKEDKIVCQENCVFAEYNYTTSKAVCSCEVKEASSSFSDMKINKTKILDNFINIKNFLNFNFLVCHKKLFCKKGIINNIGSYVILGIILFHIITLIIFSINKFHSLINKIQNIIIIFNRKENNKEIDIDKSNKMLTSNKRNKKIRTKIKNKKKFKNFYSIKRVNKIRMKFIDEEYNNLSYKLAMIYDKRTYCEYYISLLKTQHNFISSFFNNNDYNSKIIKINLFFIGFAIEYTVNGLFYTDETMHKIYENKGEFDFVNQLPITIYSYLISMILNSPLNFLALSNDAILNFKNSNIKINIKKKAKNLKNILTIKFILYFIISFIFLVFFWYYISMFGVIYKNTQIHLLKDTLMSFGSSLFLPLGYFLLPGFFRISALIKQKNKRICLYNFSKFLQAFWIF